jgi:hypothetical protein
MSAASARAFSSGAGNAAAEDAPERKRKRKIIKTDTY